METTEDPQQISVLHDRSADTSVLLDGYATLPEPWLDAAGAAALRQRFFDLYPGAHEGWHNAFNLDDPIYRAAAMDVLSAALDERLRAEFAGHEPFLYTYLVKWPGADATRDFLYLHRDWMYIDESEGQRCYVAFVALEDIDDTNGVVSVLPGGHDMDDMLRGTGMSSPWLDELDVPIREQMVEVPLRAGEAVVWDCAVVHASASNRSTEPRVAVGVWLRPVGTPLVHYRRTGDDTADLHEVDAEFFRTQTPETIDAFLRDREPRSSATIGDPGYGAADLERVLRELRLGRPA